MHPFINLFGRCVPVYDLMLIVGFILASYYWYRAGADLGLKKITLFLVILLGFFVQLFGGMIIPFLHRRILLHQHLVVSRSGLCPGRYFHSSFLSVIIYIGLISKALKWPVKKMFDNLMVSIMIMSTIGRIGCLAQGCCGGKPTNMPWGIIFPCNPDVAVHPTQIYMFFSELAIVGILLWIQKRRKYDGQTFWVGLFIYSIYRILIEFFRTNPVFLYGLTHAQVFSVITLFISGSYLYFKKFGVAFFRRDPERTIASQDEAVLSPADGRVAKIVPCDSDMVMNEPCSKISIHLSLFDVHVNRAPVSGIVESIRYSPGKFHFAFTKKASAENENNRITISSGQKKIMIRQIAGKLARRIVCYCKEGDSVRQGDRIGMIKFGSCVQVYLPANFEIKIKVGEKIRAGETVIACLKE